MTVHSLDVLLSCFGTSLLFHVQRPLGCLKCRYVHIIGVPEGQKRKKGPEKIFEEIIAKNFPNMGKEIVNQVQEAQRVPGRVNSRTNTLRHTLIKLTKI